MPSFDVVCEFDAQEVSNAVDQANRQVDNRYDFKGSGAAFSLDKDVIQLTAQSKFQLQQMMEILRPCLTKRGVDLGHIDPQAAEVHGDRAKMKVLLVSGIAADEAKKIVKLIKGAKLKVQAAIQGEQLRITGKKRDDLQATISFLKEQSLSLPLEYNNFRD